MKNILILGLGILVLIVLFADGGLEVSPTVSPALNFSPAVDLQYSPSTTTIESQTNIGTNIEHQTVIVGNPGAAAAMPAPGGNGVTLLDPVGGQCRPAPGEMIIGAPDTKGACFVVDSAGNRFFLNAAGSRWPLVNNPGAVAPLQPLGADLTLDELQAAFLRNGGELPWLWDVQPQAWQIDWLKEQAETWR